MKRIIIAVAGVLALAAGAVRATTTSRQPGRIPQQGDEQLGAQSTGTAG